MTPTETILYIARISEVTAWQAGVGGMETAGSIISYLANHPEQIDAFMAGGSVMDWPVGWHTLGSLTWHGADGKVHDPETIRRHLLIKKMEKGGGPRNPHDRP